MNMLPVSPRKMLAGYKWKNKKEIIQVPEDINEDVAFAKLKSMNIEIDSLTPEQKAYINDFQEGT